MNGLTDVIDATEIHPLIEQLKQTNTLSSMLKVWNQSNVLPSIVNNVNTTKTNQQKTNEEIELNDDNSVAESTGNSLSGKSHIRNDKKKCHKYSNTMQWTNTHNADNNLCWDCLKDCHLIQYKSENNGYTLTCEIAG